MELLQYRDYRPYLKDLLENRISANPKYSLRAFARDLKVSPQVLSPLLRGKKGISTDVAAQIAERLELNPKESNYFMDLVTLVHARSQQAKRLAEYRIRAGQDSGSTRYFSLDVEAFKVISDWHHYAILELAGTKRFKNDSKWIAHRLQISSHEVNQAIERLKALELLEDDGKGSLRKTKNSLSASFGIPSGAIRKFTRQMLAKAIESLEQQTMQERDITTITMAIDPKRLPKASKMITEFRRALCEFLEKGERTEVYTFIPALFRLSKPESKETL
jgi:uncharacterized protein (TIGR02147 family)